MKRKNTSLTYFKFGHLIASSKSHCKNIIPTSQNSISFVSFIRCQPSWMMRQLWSMWRKKGHTGPRNPTISCCRKCLVEVSPLCILIVFSKCSHLKKIILSLCHLHAFLNTAKQTITQFITEDWRNRWTNNVTRWSILT